MHSSIAALSSLTIALALAACASQAPRPASLAEAQGTWQLDATTPVGGRIPTMTIGKDGSLHGNGGVNQYSASFDAAALPQGKWRMSPARSTRMAGPQEAMALEQAMLDAMQQADGAQIEGERLCLLRGNVVLIRFVRPRL